MNEGLSGRRVDAFTRTRFDVVVIGGGIVGAFAAWDAALRGLATALIESDDFGALTSANSLKLVHGGLRHLQHGNVHAMRASMRERRTWLRIAPHLVEPLPILVPVFRGGRLRRAVLRLGLAANDLVSADRNRGLPATSRIPGGRSLTRAQCLALVPELERTTVSGGVLFHDGRMHSPERIVLEVVEAAEGMGAVVANRVACVGPLLEAGRRAGVLARDLASGAEVPVRARAIVNACGPWADHITALLGATGSAPAPIPSLALNLVLPGRGHDVAFALEGSSSTPTGAGGGPRRRLFVVPWRGRTMVGTGHAPFSGSVHDLAGIGPGHPAFDGFLAEVNRAWPAEPIAPDDVVGVHAGLLPAHPATVDAGGAGGHGGGVHLLTRPRIEEHRDAGAPVVTVVGVKFTTARLAAEQAVDRVCRLLGHRGASSRTAWTPLPGAPPDGVPACLAEAREELGAALPDDVIVHLVRTHGAAYPEVAAWRARDAGWAERVRPDEPVIRAQLLHAVHREMAGTADDVLHRRTELGARGLADDAARVMAEEALAGARGVTGSGESSGCPGHDTWLIDAHAHFHDCFEWEAFAEGALAATREAGAETVCLLIADPAGARTVHRVATGDASPLPAGWEVAETAEAGSVRLERAGAPRIVLVQGRQIRTREGLEVLALCCDAHLPDGLGFEQAIRASRAAGAVTVVPWGFGKWWLGRGATVRRMVRGSERHAQRGATLADAPGLSFLGDNGNRPAVGRRPGVFRLAESRGVPVLAGSDPLPFPGHARRTASWGFRLCGRLDPDRPASTVRQALEALPASPTAIGVLRSASGFVADQARMQLPARRAKRASATIPAKEGR